MVPAMTEPGRSFKGAVAYYAHDKRQEGEAERLTSDRVAWTHTVNLATDDPERAWRIMAHTAMSQDELKAAAGGEGDRAETDEAGLRLFPRMASRTAADQGPHAFNRARQPEGAGA